MTTNQIKNNARKEYHVTPSDLPISCPTEDMTLWNAHPRVFLPLQENNKEQVCPYCGIKYVLKSD